MKFNYNSHSLKSGIYKITNIHTGRFYIGQAKRFKERWTSHSSSLRNGKHYNTFLQADYNKCKQELGHDDFLIFEVLEVMENSTKEERTAREQSLVDTFFDNCSICYNMAKECKIPDPEITKKNWSNPEFKAKVSKAISATKKLNADKTAEESRERWSDPEFKQMVVERLKEACSTEEHRTNKKQGYLKAKQRREADPAKQEEYKAKCSEHAKKLWASGLLGKETKESRKNKSEAARKRVAEGKSDHLKVNSFKQTRTYLIMEPTGDIVEVSDVKSYVADKGLELIKFRCLCYGKIKQYDGFKCVGFKR